MVNIFCKLSSLKTINVALIYTVTHSIHLRDPMFGSQQKQEMTLYHGVNQLYQTDLNKIKMY